MSKRFWFSVRFVVGELAVERRTVCVYYQAELRRIDVLVCIIILNERRKNPSASMHNYLEQRQDKNTS